MGLPTTRSTRRFGRPFLLAAIIVAATAFAVSGAVGAITHEDDDLEAVHHDVDVLIKPNHNNDDAVADVSSLTTSNVNNEDEDRPSTTEQQLYEYSATLLRPQQTSKDQPGTTGSENAAAYGYMSGAETPDSMSECAICRTVESNFERLFVVPKHAIPDDLTQHICSQLPSNNFENCALFIATYAQTILRKMARGETSVCDRLWSFKLLQFGIRERLCKSNDKPAATVGGAVTPEPLPVLATGNRRTAMFIVEGSNGPAVAPGSLNMVIRIVLEMHSSISQTTGSTEGVIARTDVAVSSSAATFHHVESMTISIQDGKASANTEDTSSVHSVPHNRQWTLSQNIEIVNHRQHGKYNTQHTGDAGSDQQEQGEAMNVQQSLLTENPRTFRHSVHDCAVVGWNYFSSSFLIWTRISSCSTMTIAAMLLLCASLILIALLLGAEVAGTSDDEDDKSNQEEEDDESGLDRLDCKTDPALPTKMAFVVVDLSYNSPLATSKRAVSV